MKNTVKVAPYDPQWAVYFEKEAALIQNALGENCIVIHHIGSTAIPGLSAKPVIDMIPVVEDIFAVNHAVSAMQELGYESKGENGILFRHFFQKSDDIACNIHVFQQGTPDIERHILFRDWMRTHAEDRDAYQHLKIDLAKKFPDDITRYCLGKDAFVAAIDAKTGFDGLRVVHALTDREWDIVKRHSKNILADKNHVYLVLYKGSEVIGYAHIELCPEHRAKLHMIFVDEPYNRQGVNTEFLHICTRWLQQQGITNLEKA